MPKVEDLKLKKKNFFMIFLLLNFTSEANGYNVKCIEVL